MTWTPTDYIGTAIVMLFAGAILAGVLYAILPTVGMIAGILLGVLCTTWLSIGVIAKGVEVGIRSSSHR